MSDSDERLVRHVESGNGTNIILLDASTFIDLRIHFPVVRRFRLKLQGCGGRLLTYRAFTDLFGFRSSIWGRLY